MNRALLRFALSVVAAAGCRVAMAGYTVVVSEIGNLAEQLDTITGLVSGNREGYRAYWEKGWIKDDEDRRQLEAWARIRAKYRVEFEAGAPLDMPLLSLGGPIEVAHKLRIAGYQATGIDDYAQRVDLLLSPEDQAVMMAAIRRFAPRFHEWWQSEGLEIATGFSSGLVAALEGDQVKDRVRQFYRFYNTPIAIDYPVKFVLMVRPNGVTGPTHGENLESYEVIEFGGGEKSAGRVPVMLHELCHFYSATRDAGNVKALQNRFAADSSGLGVPAYNLLEESVATAFGNGMIGRLMLDEAKFKRNLDRKGGFYNEEFIDASAKALLPLLERWLREGRTIDDPAFASEYIATLRSALGERLACPAVALYRNNGFVEDALLSAARPAIAAEFYTNVNNLHSGGIADLDPVMFDATPKVTAWILIQPGSLDRLVAKGLLDRKAATALRAEASTAGQGAYGIRRKSGGRLYVLVATKPEHAATIIKRLATTRSELVGLLRDPSP